MNSDWPILTKLRCKLQRGCYTQANCLETLQKVEGRSTFLTTCNATIAVAKWGVTREFFFATWFVALQVARKIASCNMVLRLWAITTEFGAEVYCVRLNFNTLELVCCRLLILCFLYFRTKC